jgi:hypothetical protein
MLTLMHVRGSRVVADFMVLYRYFTEGLRKAAKVLSLDEVFSARFKLDAFRMRGAILAVLTRWVRQKGVGLENCAACIA